MSSPWTNANVARPDASQLIIERAHEEFLRGNADDARLGDVRGMVRESWLRSAASHVGAEAVPRIELAADDIRRHRAEHPLASVMDMIRALLIPGSPEESGVVIAVGDASGRLLWVEGDRTVRTLTGAMGFIPGTNWAEDIVGTSAPGTALTLDRSVQIRGAEHFNRLVQPWSCTAAPVHDPETRRLLGVIDVTGGGQVVTAQAQLLVDATARAVEGELLLARMRARQEARPPRRRRAMAADPLHVTLRVLGRDRALLVVTAHDREHVTELSARHAELLLMLARHPEGLSAQRLAELVYGDPAATVTLRAELVRLRKVLERCAPQLVPASRPYRLGVSLDTDAHQVLSLLDRGAHRVALSAYCGGVLPDSQAPGVEEFRDAVRLALRESIIAEARLDVLLAFADSPDGADDAELLRLCLSMLPARSPRRAGIVARLGSIEA